MGSPGMYYYMLLSGEHPSLSYGEALALLETYGIRPRRAIVLTQLLLFKPDNHTKLLHVLGSIVRRAGYIREVGVALLYDIDVSIDTIISDVNTMLEDLGWNALRVEQKNIRRLSTVDLDVLKGSIVRSIKAEVNYRSNNLLRIIGVEGIIVIAFKLYEQPSRDYYRRRPSTRPFFRSIALSVRLSRALINLARAREGEVFLDPFAGTGSVVIEAKFMGLRSIGVDVNWELVRGGRKNIAFYKLLSEEIIGDALTLPLPSKSIDAIATDPPYGRAASTYGRNVLEVYKGFLAEAYRVLRRGRYMSFIAPADLSRYIEELACRAGFIVAGRYYIYVHSGLTRVVYVVYKR